MGKKLPQRALVWIEYNTVNTHQPQGKTGKKKAPTKSVGLLPQVSASPPVTTLPIIKPMK